MVEKETVEQIEEVVEEVIEEVVEEPVIEEVVEDIVEEIPEPEFCVVTNCEKLNIREAPDAKAAIVCIVNAGDELMIAPDESTEDWYGVYTTSGVEGFCMKKFTMLKE